MAMNRKGLYLLIVVLVLSGWACSLQAATVSSKPTETAGELSTGGVTPIAINVTAPGGVRVIDKAALWAAHTDDPELFTLYAAIVLESDQATLGFNINHWIWRPEDKDKAGENRTNNRLWVTIPARQSGACLIVLGNYPAWMKPTRIEIELNPGDFFADRQPALDLLNDPDFPNPYFSANPAVMEIAQQEGLYSIKATGVATNHLPVEAGVSGLFMYYSADDTVIGLSTTLCSDSKSYACGGTLPVRVSGNEQIELETVLPYPLLVEPARVVLYPILETSFDQYLRDIE
jgi:hypothetical protein